MLFSLHQTVAGGLLPLAGKAAVGSRAVMLHSKAATRGVLAGKPAVTGNTRSAAQLVCAAWNSEHADAYDDGSRGDNDKAILKELALKLKGHTASLLEEVFTLKSCESELLKLRQVYYQLMEHITETSHEDADHLAADLIGLHASIRISLCYGRLDSEDDGEPDDARLLRAHWLPGSLDSSPRLQDTIIDTLLLSMYKVEKCVQVHLP